jgi:hypothetical protein
LAHEEFHVTVFERLPDALVFVSPVARQASVALEKLNARITAVHKNMLRAFMFPSNLRFIADLKNADMRRAQRALYASLNKVRA